MTSEEIKEAFKSFGNIFIPLVMVQHEVQTEVKAHLAAGGTMENVDEGSPSLKKFREMVEAKSIDELLQAASFIELFGQVAPMYERMVSSIIISKMSKDIIKKLSDPTTEWKR
jgi:hypothetical protein